MDMFSSRRQSIGPLTARLAQEYEAQFGRAPDARALTSLRQWANHATRRGKDAGPLDLAALVRRWAAQASASEAGALEPLAPTVMGAGAAEPPSAPSRQPARHQRSALHAPLTEAQAQRLIQEAVAAVQAAQPTWTEADLIRHLGERLPAQMGAMTAAGRRRAAARSGAPAPLATEAVMLSAPEWPRVPGLPAPRLGRERVRPARRGPVRHRRAAHPGGPAARRRAGDRRPAPGTRHGGAPARRGSGAAGGATPGASAPARARSASAPARACAWTRPPPRICVLTSARRAEVHGRARPGPARPAPSRRWPGSGARPGWAR